MQEIARALSLSGRLFWWPAWRRVRRGGEGRRSPGGYLGKRGLTSIRKVGILNLSSIQGPRVYAVCLASLFGWLSSSLIMVLAGEAVFMINLSNS